MASFRISAILGTPYTPPSPREEEEEPPLTPSSATLPISLDLPPLTPFFACNESLLSTLHDASLDDDSLFSLSSHLPASPSSLQSSSFDSTGTGECGAGTGESEAGAGKENAAPAAVCGSDAEDASKRPNLSYNALIMMAIRASPEGRLSLSGIYEYITTHYAFYRHSKDKNWKNSIRHNLSLCKSFTRIPREFGDPGKGAYWTIDGRTDEELTLHATTGKLRRRRSDAASSSAFRTLAGTPYSNFAHHQLFTPPPPSFLPPSPFSMLPLMQLPHIDPRLLAGLLR